MNILMSLCEFVFFCLLILQHLLCRLFHKKSWLQEMDEVLQEHFEHYDD